VRLGDSHNGSTRKFGRPFGGVRVLAVEQMQTLPFAQSGVIAIDD
jgi:hypothetical protein